MMGWATKARIKIMSKKFKVWLDSGANHQSCYEQEVTLDDMGVTDAEWESWDEDKRDEEMKQIAWDRMDWGYSEI